MNRRQFAATTLASSLVILSGCDTEPKPSALATLLNNPAVHEAFKSLESAASSLQANVADFETENWREVVENVTADSDNVSSRIENLKQALGYSDAQ